MAGAGLNPFDEAARARRRLTLAAGAAAALFLLLWAADFGSGLDLRLLDTWFEVRGPRDPSPQVVVVAIDEKAIARLGPYPWPRSAYVPLIEKLRAAGARVIGLDVTFGPNPREDEPGPALAPAEPGSAALPGPSNNERLAAAMRAAGNVVFGFEFDHLGDPSPPGSQPPEEVARQALPGLDVTGYDLLAAPVLVPPTPALGQAAAALGFVNALPDKDGTMRWYPMLIKHGDRLLPSLSFQVARVYMQARMEDVRLADGRLWLGHADIPISESGKLLLDWTSTDPRFPTWSVVEVLNDEVRPEDLRDKAVLIAATARGADDRNLPFVKTAPGVLLHATVLDNIFKLQFLSWPAWAWLLQVAMTLASLAVGVAVYPRLRTGVLLAVAPALVLVPVVASLFLFLARDLWFRPTWPALAAFLPLLPVVALKLRESERTTRDVSAEKRETELQLGLSFQEKGMLDMALAQFGKLAMDERLAAVLLNLGLDFENRGAKEKGFLAYKRVFDWNAGFEDVAARMEALRREGVGTRLFATGTVDLGSPAVAGTQAAPVAPTRMGATVAGRTTAPTVGPVATAMPTAAATPTAGLAPAGADSTMALGTARGGLAVGRAFGRYEILDKLGRGAMGDVFKVRDPKIGRVAAMKTIRVDTELSPQQLIELRQRFYREAQTAGKLTHPNIVTIYDVGEEEGISYIVMEFVEGQTLTHLIKKTKGLNAAQIKHVVVNAALGLDYAHQNGVIHRDVKPDNIMVTKTGVVKVMDFGIARIVESDMTRTGSILGTPAYMSPEQFAGKKVDARADIFSLGVVLYELVAHRRPFRGDTPTAVMFEIIQKQPQPPSEAEPGVSPLWDPVVLRALAKDPAQRYATAMELANAVRAVAVK